MKQLIEINRLEIAKVLFDMLIDDHKESLLNGYEKFLKGKSFNIKDAFIEHTMMYKFCNENAHSSIPRHALAWFRKSDSHEVAIALCMLVAGKGISKELRNIMLIKYSYRTKIKEVLEGSK